MTETPPTDAVTRQLAETLSTTTAAQLPASVHEATHRAVIDWLGSVVAGAAERPARAVQHVVAALGASEEATVIAAGRASAAAAGLANGVAAHILELDDIHKGSTVHAAAPVISAAFAVAERHHADGSQFMLAVTLGYEAALRIGEAVNPSHYQYWHPTGTVATFGAAAAAGSLLRLTPEEMVDALGTAGTQAAGLWEFNSDGAMSKHLHPGKAAFNGILAADLARLGFTGARRILEGPRGFFRAMSTSYDASRVTAGLGRDWKITENCYKLHACCGHTHAAIDVALALRADPRWPARDPLAHIASVEIETYGPGYAIVKEPDPRTPYQAQFSIAYCVAVALLEGAASLHQFTRERFASGGVRDTTVHGLLQRTHASVREDLTARYPAAWPARLAVRLTDGTELTGSSDYPRGNPENPVSSDVLERKAWDLIASRWGEDVANDVSEVARHIPECQDIAQVLRDVVPLHHERAPARASRP